MSIWSSADTVRIVQLAFEIIFISLVIALNFRAIEVFTSQRCKMTKKPETLNLSQGADSARFLFD